MAMHLSSYFPLLVFCGLAACSGTPDPDPAPVGKPVLKTGPLAFQPPQLLALPPTATAIPGSRYAAAGDLDGDGLPDLAMYDGNNYALFIYYSQSEGGFTVPQVIPTIEQSLTPIRAGDLDGDGHGDVAMLPVEGGNAKTGVDLLLGGPDKRPRAQQSVFPVYISRSLVLADLDRDGRLDVIAGGKKDGVSVLLNRGQANGLMQVESRLFALMAGIQTITAADIDQDGKIDVVALGYPLDDMTTNAWIFGGRGDGDLGPPVQVNLKGRINAITFADIDRRGSPELLTLDTAAGVVTMLQRVGTAMYEHPISFVVGKSFASPLHALDMDNDGWLDVIALAEGGVAVMLNDGTGTFTRQLMRFDPMLPAYYDLIVADFNQDTRLDIAAPISHSQLGLGVLFAQ